MPTKLKFPLALKKEYKISANNKYLSKTLKI